MSTALERSIYDALAGLLMRWGVPNVAKVTSFYEDTYIGRCDTCEYTTIEMDISYTRIDGTTGSYTYDGSFSELLGQLS